MKRKIAILLLIVLMFNFNVTYAMQITGSYNLKIKESVVVYNGSGIPINARVTPVIANKEDTIYSLLLDEKASTTFNNTKTVDSKANRTTEFNLTGIPNSSQQTVNYEYLLRVNTFDFELVPEKVGTDYVYDTSLNIYLQSSAKIESDNSLIINKANEIKSTIIESNRNNPYYITKAIYDYIVTHMNYSNDTNYSNKGALNAVQYLVGNCEDYSTFMVALLRASNIPARDITGYRIKVTDGKSSEINLIDPNDYKRHAWVEVYLKGYGWVFFDPTISSATLKSYPIKDSNGNTMTYVNAYAPLSTPDYKNFAKTGDIYIKERIDYNEGVIKASVTKTPASLDSLSFAQQVNYTEFTPYDSISILESISYSEQPATLTVQGLRGGIPNSIPNSIVVWTTSNTNVATVEDGIVTFTGNSGNVTITASHNGLTDTVTTSVNPPALSSIKINEVLPTTGTIKLTVTGTYSDNSTQPIEEGVTWTSSDTSFATVNANGNVIFTDKDNGTVSITATYNGKSDTVSVNIPAKPVEVTLSSIKINEVLPTTGTIKLTVTGTYSDNSTQPITSGITWTSSDTSFATVDNQGNVTLTGKDDGTVSITATYNGKSDTVSVNVPKIVPTLSNIKINETLPTTGTIKLTVTATYSDNTTQIPTNGVTWSSSDVTFATVDNQGNVTFTDKDNGTVSITATYEGKTDTVSVNIPKTIPTLSSIKINEILPTTGTIKLTVTATYSDNTTQVPTSNVTWSSSDDTFATVDNQGNVTFIGKDNGTVSITATYEGKTDTVSVNIPVKPVEVTLSSIKINEALPTTGTIKLTVTATYSDNTTQVPTSDVTWSSSDDTFATVDVNGNVTFTGKDDGTVSITAIYNGKSDTVSVNIPAKSVEVILSSIKINETLPTTGTIKLTVTGMYSDNSTQPIASGITWTSSDTSFATVDVNGNVTFTGKDDGTVSITAIYNGKSDTVSVNIPAKQVEVTLSSIKINEVLPTTGTIKLTVTGTYSDNSTQPIASGITWTSSDVSFAVVDNQGNVALTGKDDGTVSITATYNGKSNTVSVDIPKRNVPKTLSKIEIIRSLPTKANKGNEVQLYADAIYSDNSRIRLNNKDINWLSDNIRVANVNNEGLVVFSGETGSVSIIAIYQDKQTTVSTTITGNMEIPPVIDNTPTPLEEILTWPNIRKIQITGKIPNERFTQPVQLQVFAIMRYSDEIYNITDRVTWRVYGSNVVQVDKNGKVTWKGGSGVVVVDAIFKNYYGDYILANIPKDTISLQKEIKETQNMKRFKEDLLHIINIAEEIEQIKTMNISTIEPFNDTKKHTHDKEIRIAKNLKIITSDAKNNFRPNENITREDFADIIFKVFNTHYYLEDVRKIYPDIKGRPTSDAIYALRSIGVMKGYLDNTFRPTANITRAEAISVIAKFINTENVALKPTKYTDIQKSYAKKDIETLYSLGVLDQIAGKDKFEPDKKITRAEVVSIAVKLLEGVIVK